MTAVETIVTATAYFHGQVIIGFVLVYTSGKTASIGDFDIATRRVIHFAWDAQIVGLSVVVTEHDLMELEFEFVPNNHEQPLYKRLRLSPSIPLMLMARPIPGMTGEKYGVKMGRLRKATSSSWRAAGYTSRQASRNWLVLTWAVRISPVLGHYTSPNSQNRPGDRDER